MSSTRETSCTNPSPTSSAWSEGVRQGWPASQALLQKRLLVPCAVAIFASAFNALDLPFDFNYGPVLLGFVTYKAAVLSIVYEDVKGDITRAIAGNATGSEEQ